MEEAVECRAAMMMQRAETARRPPETRGSGWWKRPAALAVTCCLPSLGSSAILLRLAHRCGASGWLGVDSAAAHLQDGPWTCLHWLLSDQDVQFNLASSIMNTLSPRHNKEHNPRIKCIAKHSCLPTVCAESRCLPVSLRPTGELDRACCSVMVAGSLRLVTRSSGDASMHQRTSEGS